MDENFVQCEVRKHADRLREMRSTSKDSSDEPTQVRSGRRKSHWRNYRQLSLDEIVRIKSFERLSRILANEVHVSNVTSLAASERSNDRFAVFEKQLSELMHASEANMTTKDMVALVKCLYHFSIVNKLTSFSLVNSILGRLEVKQLKPRNVVYLLEALSRFQFRDHRILEYLDSVSLCWPKLQCDELLIIKAANAIARLDVAKSSPYLGGLVASLSEILPRLTKSQLERVKWVCVVELFDEVMVLDYFVLAHSHQLTYRRHLILVYLQFRSNESIMAKLPLEVKEWIEELIKRDSEFPYESFPLNSHDSLRTEIAAIVAQTHPRETCTVGQRCGPFTLDILLGERTVLEVCSPFQFYARTVKFTAEARHRHALLRSLGFDVVLIPHFASDQERRALILKSNTS